MFKLFPFYSDEMIWVDASIVGKQRYFVKLLLQFK